MPEYANNEFLAFFFKRRGDGERLLGSIAASLEQQTPYRIWDRWLSPERHIAFLNISKGAPPLDASLLERLRSTLFTSPLVPNRLRVHRQIALLQVGYTTTAPRTWERTLQHTDGRLRCEDAGGIAAFCVATFSETTERLFLWSTRPGLRSIATAETPDMVIAGTRPRLVHRAARGFDGINLDREYVRSCLTGWSLGERTPYDGTSLIPVDAMMRIEKGLCTLHEHPTGRYTRARRSLLRHQTSRYRAALRDAVEPLRRVQGFELRLSGGKDSRLVAACLSDRRIVPTTTICHGIPGEWETPVAERVARALGWQIKFAVPEFAYRGGILETVRYNLSLADGFFATEPLQVPYPQYGISGDRGPAFVMGHIELQRGGWAKSLKSTKKEALSWALERLTPLRGCVAPDLCQSARSTLHEYAESIQVENDADYLYWINYRFRVCRWLTSHYLVHSRDLLPVYPLLDEKVVRIVSSAPLEHLTSERLVFSTMRSMAPQLEPIPLFKERYRFESKKPIRSFARYYADRAPVQPGPSTYLKREVVLPGDVLGTLCEHIRHGKLREELREVTRPEIWSVIEEPNRGRIDQLPVPRRTFASYLWTCFQASVLFTEPLSDP